jgi:hypothetical protein
MERLQTAIVPETLARATLSLMGDYGHVFRLCNFGTIPLASSFRGNDLRLKEAPPAFEPRDWQICIRCHDSATLERTKELGQRSAPEVPAGVPSLSEVISSPPFPTDLAGVVSAWDRLPEAIKAGILALVRAGGEPNP